MLETKVYKLYAGPNGAGKTTFYKTNMAYPDEKRVNSDEILKENRGDWSIPKDQFLAMKEAARRIRTYIDQGVSFNQETTLAGRSIFVLLKKAKDRGYGIKLYYVGLESEDLAVQRVNERVKNGGHGIPEEDVRRRYRASMENLARILPLCESVEIYDNSIHFYEVGKMKNGVWMKLDVNCLWLKRDILPGLQ